MKEKIQKLIDSFFSKYFIFYIVFAGIATIIDWASFAFSTYSMNLHYILSVIISFTLGSITNFSLNKYFNFKNKYKKISIQFILFLLVAIIGLIITILLMYLFVDVLLINKLISRIITTGIVLFYSFLGHKFITFRILK